MKGIFCLRGLPINNAIFYKTSLDEVNLPEQLNDYIRASNPGIVVVLAAIFVLLAAAIVWSVTWRHPTSISAVGVVEDSRMLCRACQPPAPRRQRFCRKEHSILRRASMESKGTENSAAANCTEAAISRLVRPEDVCPLWEEGNDCLVPMRECWFCKYSDFRKNTSVMMKQSVCRHPLNQKK